MKRAIVQHARSVRHHHRRRRREELSTSVHPTVRASTDEKIQARASMILYHCESLRRGNVFVEHGVRERTVNAYDDGRTTATRASPGLTYYFNERSRRSAKESSASSDTRAPRRERDALAYAGEREIFISRRTRTHDLVCRGANLHLRERNHRVTRITDPQTGVAQDSLVTRAAMCVRLVDVRITCGLHDDAQLAAVFIDPRAK